MDNANIYAITECDAIARRQLLKYSSNSFKARMINAVTEQHPMHRKMRKSFICSKVLKRSEDGEKVTSIYCKTKYCFTCNAIRSAIFIDKYEQPIKDLFDAQFVTLTRKTCRDRDTPKQIREMDGIWRKIANKSKRVKYKRKYDSFIGIRKSEATLNHNGETHYHYHILIDGKAQAEWLLAQWLQYNGKLTSRKAQKIQKADERSVLELAKYASKMSIKHNLKIDYSRYARLFYQLRGKRSYQPFGGFKAAVLDDENFDEHLTSQAMDRVLHDDYYVWQEIARDWVGTDTGVLFSGEEIPYDIRKLWNDIK